MLGEKKIVAFSPELGNSNSESDNFYPNINLLLKEILPQNLIPALYAIQRVGYYLRFFTLKNSYLECSIIQDYQHKFMDQSEDEKKELSICRENNHLYQFSNTIALKNTGFSDFQGKAKIMLLINLNNVKYLSIKTDSGSNKNSKLNIKKKVFDKNITEVIESFNNIEINKNKADGEYFDINDDNKNIIFMDKNTYFLLTEIEQENINNQNFNLLDIKLYFTKDFIKNHFSELDKIDKSKQKESVSVKLANNIDKENDSENNKNKKAKHPENDTFKRINLDDFLITAYLENDFISVSKNKLDGIPNLNRYLNEKNSKSNSEFEDTIKNDRLYFANDNYKIKLNQFEIFEIKKKQYKEFTLIEGLLDLIIYCILIFLLILSIGLVFYKIKLWYQRCQIRKKMDILPDSSRTTNLSGKRYAELQALENSIIERKDLQTNGPNYDF